jgi:F0F1-type ATP synthase assembly protein I
MSIVKREQESLQKQNTNIEKKDLSINEIKIRDEHYLRIGAVIIFTLFLGIVLTGGIFLVFLNCLQIITAPWYVISPIIVACIACIRYVVRRMMNYLFPVKK